MPVAEAPEIGDSGTRRRSLKYRSFGARLLKVRDLRAAGNQPGPREAGCENPPFGRLKSASSPGDAGVAVTRVSPRSDLARATRSGRARTRRAQSPRRTSSSTSQTRTTDQPSARSRSVCSLFDGGKHHRATSEPLSASNGDRCLIWIDRVNARNCSDVLKISFS